MLTAEQFGGQGNWRPSAYRVSENVRALAVLHSVHTPYWDVSTRLGELDLSVLVTSGRYDEMTPALVQPLVAGIRGAESVVFDKSAHFATAEEPNRYREVLDSFLGEVEAGAR